MTAILKVASKTIGRRLERGESFAAIVADYPKLTAEQTDEIKKELNVNE